VDVLGGWGALDRRLVVGGVADSVAVVTDFGTLDLIAAAAPAADAGLVVGIAGAAATWADQHIHSVDRARAVAFGANVHAMSFRQGTIDSCKRVFDFSGKDPIRLYRNVPTMLSECFQMGDSAQRTGYNELARN
jgi:hypothetical protein